MRKIKISIPLFILLFGTVIPIQGILVSLAGLDKYWREFSLSFVLSLILMDWITKKEKAASIWTGIAMIIFGDLFFIGSLFLKQFIK
ncbi:hypothetical protein [Thermoactinomyces sp. CICC 10522]|uniref:hypothetical protein n=1 Tax=Thermoactinomyces sp. CICC 10522 TaxID=2767427 RepID=UPI0018DE66A2|nr:hypothetical protein [Thermoactinomyces sp. CICC 10522]MBH8605849.1 hypothetical protein [Thermoactinomyces sp. CICC 10522]